MLSDNKIFDIISVGDCVMDCIMYVDRMPKIGETMKGNVHTKIEQKNLKLLNIYIYI